MLHDLRTVWPYARHALRRPHAPAPEAWETVLVDPDVGAVRLSGELRAVPGARECVVIAHGLGGSSSSYYVLRGAGAAAELGMSSLALCLRGADRRGEDFYNIALWADLAAAVASPALAGYERVYVLGYSMGGYVTLHFARYVDDERVRAVAVLCTPIDLKAAQTYIDTRRAWFYRHHCLAGLKSIYAAVAGAHPGRIPTADERVQAVRTMWDWDALAIAPRYGYDSPEAYYDALTLRRHLGDFRVPALLLATRGDPIIPPRTIEPFLDTRRGARRHALELRWSSGGHVTFPAGLDLGYGPRPGADAQLLSWMRARP